MKKRTRNILLGLVVASLLVYFGVSYFLGFVVVAAVNRIGPKITQTPVVLTSAHISPLSGSGVLSGLSVANPPGWTSPRLLQVNRITVLLKPFSIFGDHIIIDELIIDQPEFTYETKFFSSNVNDLMNNMSQGKSGSVATTGKSAQEGQPVRFEIRHLMITHGKVILGVGTRELPLPLPTVESRDVGSNSGGVTSDQLALAVMKSVSSEIVATTANAAGKIGKTAGAAATERVKKAEDSLKKIFGGGK